MEHNYKNHLAETSCSLTRWSNYVAWTGKSLVYWIANNNLHRTCEFKIDWCQEFQIDSEIKRKNASYFAYREEQRVTMQLFLQPWSKGLWPLRNFPVT